MEMTKVTLGFRVSTPRPTSEHVIGKWWVNATWAKSADFRLHPLAAWPVSERAPELLCEAHAHRLLAYWLEAGYSGKIVRVTAWRLVSG